MPAPEGNTFAEGNDGGRPTEYTAQFLTYAKKYLLEYNQKPNDEVIPTIEGLALFTGVNRSTLYRWLEDSEKEEFRGIYERLMAMQGRDLVNNGLTEKYSAPISKLLLTKHGYVEKTETKNVVEFDEPTPKDKEKLDKIINAAQKPTVTTESSKAGTQQPSVAGSDKGNTGKP